MLAAETIGRIVLRKPGMVLLVLVLALVPLVPLVLALLVLLVSRRRRDGTGPTCRAYAIGTLWAGCGMGMAWDRATDRPEILLSSI